MCQRFSGELIVHQIKSHSINLSPNSECERGPTLGRKTCANPRKSYNVCTTSHLPIFSPQFLPRARVCVRNIQNSENVRLPKVQKYSTLPCSLARSASFSLFSVKNSSLLSILFTVGRLSCTDPFRIISLSLFQEVLFLFLTSNFFLSRVLKLTTAIYYISISYMLTFKFILICHLFVFPNLSVILTSECQQMISTF